MLTGTPRRDIDRDKDGKKKRKGNLRGEGNGEREQRQQSRVKQNRVGREKSQLRRFIFKAKAWINTYSWNTYYPDVPRAKVFLTWMLFILFLVRLTELPKNQGVLCPFPN